MAYDPMDALDPEARTAKPIKQPKSPKSPKSHDPMDALDMPADNRQGFADQPGPILAEWYEEPIDTSDRPKYLGELPPQQLGRIETNPETQRKEYVEGPGKIRAEFTDQPDTGKVSAQGLARAHKDTARLGKQGLAGGTLQGATFRFADELAAVVDSLRGKGNYRQLRDENRKAFADAEAGDPGAFATGNLIGGAATVALPGVGMGGAGKSLLSLGNVARGTGYGALQAAGESNADVASGEGKELVKFALDVGKGGAAGGLTTAGLGLAGKGLGKAGQWLATAPERQTTRADDALWQLITRGADKTKREELAGVLGSDRGDVLAMARSNPAFMETLKRGDKAAAADMVLSAQPEVLARREAAIAASEAKTTGARAVVGKPIIAEMEKRRDAIRATPTPENMAAADKWQKRIDALNEAWMPAPKAPELKGEALASRLTANADRGTVERAAKYAPDFGKVAEKYKLGKGVDDLAERQKKIGGALETLNEKTSAIYERPKQDVYVANVTGKLREWADELRQAPGGIRTADAAAVDKMRAQVSEWAKAAGTEATGSKTTMTAKELRQLITNVQGKAFSGSYVDPTEAKAMQRELSGKLREVLDAHVAEHGRPSDVKKLAELNKEISALITFQESGEREGVEAFKGLHKATPAVAAPDTRNGRARVEQLYKLIQSTDDPEAKRVLTGELYRQIGPEATKRLTGIEREESLLERLGTVTKAGAEQKAGDSERGKRLGHLFDRHNPISSVIAKYGDALADKANSFAMRAENLRRRGASNRALRALGKSMGIGAEVVEDVIRVVAPKGAGAQAVGK
jgi:hypothetical protein